MKNKFNLVILNGSRCSPQFLDHYHKIYSHWKTMWQNTFKELDGHTEVLSDNFLRQSEVLGIFHDEKCIAVVCHRYIDLLPSAFDDSYFQSWPELILKKIKNLSPQVAIGNQISIDPEFRKIEKDLSMKDMLLWFSLKRLQEQNASIILGSVREDKSLDTLFIKYGATILQKNVEQHNVPVSLLYFDNAHINLTAAKEWEHEFQEIYTSKIEDQIYLTSFYREKLNEAA